MGFVVSLKPRMPLDQNSPRWEVNAREIADVMAKAF